jgi:hypothetical protein
MDRLRSSLNAGFLVLAVYGAFFGGYFASRRWGRPRLDTIRPGYYHDEFVDIRLRSRNVAFRRRWAAAPPKARVLKGGVPVETIAGLREVALAFDEDAGAWIGRWPCPWNAPPGTYRLELAGEPEASRDLAVRPFSILRRTPRRLGERFAVLTWESVRPLAALRVKAPDGSEKDWRGLLDWAGFVGADAFWMLGGQTPGRKPGEVWVQSNLDLIPEVARECRRRGLKFGVWAMCYLTMSAEDRVPGYEYALEVKDGRPAATRSVSLRDGRRLRDVADFLRRFRDVPEVDFLGLDYIRNAQGGYELVDDFYADMPFAPKPPGFERMSREERMADFARRKVAREDGRLIDAWQWWRAHRVGRVIRELRRELGEGKPLWAFCLTWDRGWHHGQDAVMFNDAGADALALMLYEADRAQFGQMLKDWRSYVRRQDAQMIVGDIVDWPLHQRSPSGPGELSRRLRQAGRSIYADGPAAGIFIHDLDRALNGRLGPFTTRDWMEEARRTINWFKDSGGKT